MIVDGFTMDLYCDGPRHRELHPNKINSRDASYYGRTWTDCAKQARKEGWKLDRPANSCVCSNCRKAAAEPTP